MSNMLSNAFEKNEEFEIINRLVKEMKESNYLFKLIKQQDNHQYLYLMQNYIYNFIYEKMEKDWHEENRKYVINFIVKGSISIIEEWMKSGCSEDEKYI